MQELTPESKKLRPWPDMSAYGLHFGVLEMRNGEPRLVMVDKNDTWGELARQMGFQQSRWLGLYVKSSLKLTIPGIRTNFPATKVVMLSDEEIRESIKTLILERKDQRLSSMNAKGRLSWHPHKTTTIADAVAKAVTPEEDEASTMTPEQALRQTTFLGRNFLGQEVFEAGDGLRFARSNEQVVANETENTGRSPAFLRAGTDEELVQVAAGMVQEIVAGQRLHSDDFIRFVEAVFGEGSSENKDHVSKFHDALDQAMLDRVISFEGAGQDTFAATLQLHEGRPSFWRAQGSFSTPLPIAVAMQSLVAARIQQMEGGAPPRVIDITTHPKSHSWAFESTSTEGGELPSHDVTLAGVFGKPSEARSIGGVRITRTDTEALMSSLSTRTADGLSVFVMTTDKAGKLDSEFRRVLAAIGQLYEVTSLVDLDSSMIGPGSGNSSRLIVIGKKREQPDYTYAVRQTVPVLYDYASLWNWTETLRAAHLGEVQTFGDDGREENRWQAPYIPASQVSEPQAMVPRNLLGPMREALADIKDRHGMGIDEYVCDRMGWSMERLTESLDAEQTDALAIAIQSIDDGTAMVEADATGLGKGRVAAALAAYGKKKGMPVIFMTLTADLFSDFYRDVADIGGMSELGNPFIVNNDLVVRHPTTMDVVARSPKRETAQMAFACGEFPAGHDLVLATYSQFNRIYEPEDNARSTAIARAIRTLLRKETEPFATLKSLSVHLGLGTYADTFTPQEAAAYERRMGDVQRSLSNADLAAQHDNNAALLLMDRQQLLEALASRVRSDLTTLKHQWLHSDALKGALVILDEAHVAAGEDSQTGTNLRMLKDKAGAVEYSSATFAKDVSNFQLFSRVFPSTMRVATISETLRRGGEPMQEILCAMLAKDGRLVRREHDLSNLQFKMSVDEARLPRNETWAAGFAQVLAAMSYLSGEVETIVTKTNKTLQEAAEKAQKAAIAAATRPGQKPPKNVAQLPTTGLQYTHFSAKFHPLARAFMMAVNADHAADLAIKALREDRKPVITVENTMESVLRDLLDNLDDEPETDPGDPLAALAAAAAGDGSQPAGKRSKNRAGEEIQLGRSVSFRDLLHKYVDSMFHANEQKRQGVKVLHSQRLSLLTPELAEAAKELHAVIDSMPEVPLSPIDTVRDRITAAGFTVDEISGRRLTLQRNPDGTHKVVRMSERKKLPLKNAFNSGKLDALILSRSGSTGISLHASKTFADRSQRELIELQPAQNIAERMQFWGRVNRKGQECWPIIHMLSSGLPAELRLIIMQNAKLRRMSANISGNADNSALNDDAPDILNRVGNEVCFRWMESNPRMAAILGFKVADFNEEKILFGNTKFVDMLTGRLMMLHPTEQRQVYSEITAEFNALLEQFELDGTNPLKSAEFDLRAKQSGARMLQAATNMESVFGESVAATELTYPITLPALERGPIEAQSVSGRLGLEEKFGQDYAQLMAATILKECDAMLPALLSSKHTTIAAALADEKSNAVKNAANKYAWLAERLPTIRPGSILSFADSDAPDAASVLENERDKYIERIFITGWKTPPKNVLSMSEYKITGYSARTRKKVELSMSALYSRSSLWVDASWGRDKPALMKAGVDSFFNGCATEVHGEDKRIVLEGNLYKAAEIAETERSGSAVTYSDDKGIWRHAIMMPKGYTLKNIMDMPVAVEDVDTLMAAFAVTAKSAKKLSITDDLRTKDKRSYQIAGNCDGLALLVNGSAEKTAWLVNNPEIKKHLVGGDFAKGRGERESVITPGHERAFLEAFMAHADKNSAPILMDGFMREWYNEYLTTKLATLTGQSAVDEALYSKDDEELSSLLAAP